MTKNNEPKRQHFVPIMYLKHFTNNDGYLEIYDSQENKFLNPMIPDNIGFEKHGYTIIDDNGQKDYTIEHELSKIENSSNFILEKLINKEKITKNEKEIISLFFALLSLRTPKNFNYTQNSINTYKNGFLKVIKSMENFNDAKNIPANKQLIDELESQTTRNECLDMMFGNQDFINLMINVYMNQNWLLIEIPEKYNIITTDNPVCLSTPNTNHISFIQAKKIIPISSNLILKVFGLGNEFKYIQAQTEEQVKGACANSYINRNRFVYAKEKQIINEIKNATNNYRREIKITASNLR